MKKKALLAIAVFACAMFLTGTGAREAAAFNISFDDFNDGLAINIASGGRLYGERLGAAEGVAMIGDFAWVPSVGGFVFACEGPNSADPNTPQIFYVFPNRTWQLYIWQGPTTPPNLFNSGTWSFGLPPSLGAEGEAPALVDVK